MRPSCVEKTDTNYFFYYFPGPRLPTFVDESKEEKDYQSTNSVENPVMRASMELTPRSSVGSSVEGKTTSSSVEGKSTSSGSKRHGRKGSIQERSAANNGMSMDTHASETIAGSLRRQISDSELTRWTQVKSEKSLKFEKKKENFVQFTKKLNFEGV